MSNPEQQGKDLHTFVNMEQPKPKRSCNRHSDCDAAEKEVMERRKIERWQISSDFHCHDDECPDCFGC